MHFIENPPVQVKNIIMDINIDAIGREDAASPHLKDFVYQYCSKNIKDKVEPTIQKINEDFQNILKIVPREALPGSDNYIFELKGVPAIAFTTGHSKDYHKPTDTADKINYDNYLQISRFIFRVVKEIATFLNPSIMKYYYPGCRRKCSPMVDD